MGDVVAFSKIEALVDTRARHEIFVPVTAVQGDRYFQTKLGLIEFHASQGERRAPYDVDLAALTVVMPCAHRALKAAKVRPIEVRACIEGPPVDDYASNDEYPLIKGIHIRLRFASADDKERFARQFSVYSAAQT